MLARGAPLPEICALAESGRFRAALSLLEAHAVAGGATSPEVLLLWAELSERTGQHRQALSLVTQAKAIPRLPHALAARAWLVEGSLAQHRGHRSEAAAAFLAAAEIAKTGEHAGLSCSARVRAMRVLEDGLATSAVPDSEELEREILRLGDQNLAITFHIYRAELEARAGRLGRSDEHTRIAESLLADTEHLGLAGLVQVHRSCLAYLEGHFTTAHRYALRAFSTAQESGHHCTLCVSLTNLGASYLALGQPGRAERVLGRALELAHPGTTVHTLSLETLAEVWLAGRDLDRCSSLLDEVDWRKNSAGQEFSAWHEAWTLATGVRLMQARGDWTGSLATLRGSDVGRRSGRDSPVVQRMTLLEVAALIHLGRTSEAADTLGTLEREASLRSPLLACHSVALAACLNHRLGNIAKAECQFRMALGMLSAAGEPADMLDCVEEYADLLSPPGSTGGVDDSQQWAGLPPRRPTTIYSCLARSTSLAKSHSGALSDELIGILRVSWQRDQHPKLVGELALRLLDTTGAASGGTLVETGAGKADRVLAMCGRRNSTNSSHRGQSDLRIALGGQGTRQYWLEATLARTLEAAEIGQVVVTLLGCQNATKPKGSSGTPARLGCDAGDIDTPPGTVFASACMTALLSAARRCAATDASVLITGESGTGKEVLARFVHAKSSRSAAAFVPFNCATVPRDMIDSQLFGYRRGAFTGAAEPFGGVIRAASGGTLFLDEVSELPLDVQPKLLRFLDSREVHSLGEALPRTADVRVVAASNVDLEDLVAAGRFRRDLYYRLNVFRMRIPPLRERRADIEALIERFLDDCQRRLNRRNVALSRAAKSRLMLYGWPGNVRELASEVIRLVAQSEDGQVLDCDALSPEILSRSTLAVGSGQHTDVRNLPLFLGHPLKSLLDDVERLAVDRAIEASNGSQTEAARRLGVSRKGLYLKRQRLGI